MDKGCRWVWDYHHQARVRVFLRPRRDSKYWNSTGTVQSVPVLAVVFNRDLSLNLIILEIRMSKMMSLLATCKSWDMNCLFCAAIYRPPPPHNTARVCHCTLCTCCMINVFSTASGFDIVVMQFYDAMNGGVSQSANQKARIDRCVLNNQSENLKCLWLCGKFGGVSLISSISQSEGNNDVFI